MSDELKPIGCPFCGELPEISKHFKHAQFNLMHRCKVIGPIHFDWRESKEALITPWNRRAETHDSQLTCLVNIRHAIGDNGKRMQPELVQYIKATFDALAEAKKALEGIRVSEMSDTWVFRFTKETLQRIAEIEKGSA